MAAASRTSSPLQIVPVTGRDFEAFFGVAASAFGGQTNDAIWTGFNPAWDTPTGASEGADRLRLRWEMRTRNRSGQDNTIFLKAVLQDHDNQAEGREDVIVGVAIWQQLSAVSEWGDYPHDGPEQRALLDLAALWPDHPATVKFIEQCEASLHSARVRTVKGKQHDTVPAAFVLDLCAVRPAYQRRGIAQALVQWGPDEARDRGGLECLTEASVMGRSVYHKLGFKEIERISYVVDDEFREWSKPDNVFMRTG